VFYIGLKAKRVKSALTIVEELNYKNAAAEPQTLVLNV
jgi:hypothetical protein